MHIIWRHFITLFISSIAFFRCQTFVNGATRHFMPHAVLPMPRGLLMRQLMPLSFYLLRRHAGHAMLRHYAWRHAIR